MRNAVTRFYVDADILGLAKLLVQVRHDVTYPGFTGGVLHKRRMPACPITQAKTADDVWIPEVTRHGWLIITRDRHMQIHRAEIEAIRNHGARMVALVGEDAVATWNQLEVFMCRWRQIEGLLNRSGPFIERATRDRWLEPVRL